MYAMSDWRDGGDASLTPQVEIDVPKLAVSVLTMFLERERLPRGRRG